MRRRLRHAIAILTLPLILAGPGLAQDAQTLADIRTDLRTLAQQLLTLRGELQGTGGSNLNVSGDILQRVDTIEAELSRLTAQSEALENRINRVVADGTNRVGDLDFRLTELEGGDLGALGTTEPLGTQEGGELPPVAGLEATAPAAGETQPQIGTLDSGTPDTGGVELAISERADFERAQEALAQGDFRSAADQFAAFNETYPGGPLTVEAHFLRGEAYRQMTDWKPAAQAYLDAFSGDPMSPRAAEALYNLGLALNELGQQREACMMLREVGVRFAGSEQVGAAQSSMQALGCT